MKIPERLALLVEDGAIERVLGPIMAGKEASLFIVEAEGGPCAAKVYKTPEGRAFHQRAVYTEGRGLRSSREQRAMSRKSRFGRELLESTWQNAEFEALRRLGEVGVRVPRPILFTDDVLVMSLVLGPDGRPAPRLVDLEFHPEEARNLLRFLLDQVIRMLCAGLIHGDLSEYNVLMAHDGPVVIDLPQAVSASHNRNARALLIRDVTHITRFAARFAPELHRARFGEEIWALYEKGHLAPGARLTGRFRPDERTVDGQGLLAEMASLEEDELRAQRPARKVIEVAPERGTKRPPKKPAPGNASRPGPRGGSPRGPGPRR
jgi:RIO kinase 1